MPESSAATSRNISISYLRVYESCDTNTTIIDCSLITDLGPWRNPSDDSCIATTFPPVSSSIFSDASWANSLNMPRSEEHTSELQSRFDLVCRLLLEIKNQLIY